MSLELAADVHTYAAMVRNLRLYDDWMEVTNLLVWRDAIAKDLMGGGLLGADDQSMLRDADDRLLAERSWLLRRFPRAFEDRGAPPASWWWHLRQGPDVREQALAAADRQ